MTKTTETSWQNDFDPAGSFTSPHHALCQIYEQASPLRAMLALVKEQVEWDECGFASEVVRDFMSFKND